MCGIVGILNHSSGPSSIHGILQRMLQRIDHRGPDEKGIYAGRKIGMGSARLSIIDLKTGQQPISNTNQDLWIVFNGEVYNFPELRDELAKKGHTFRTTSDTEVIVHLYEEYGEKCLPMLNGQFVFAIWNKKKQELFIARDRVGVRPMFYTEYNHQFIFASEIKAFLEVPGLSLQISPQALKQVFTFWTTLSPATIFENVYELPPGHFMRISGDSKTIAPFWQLSFPDEGCEDRRNLQEMLEEFHDLFLDAVRIRLRADVPVGAYLSGGIDSSVTTAYIKQVFPDILRTFSITFTEKEFDESGFQKMVVDYLKTEHTSITCTPDDIAAKFQDVVWYSEIPLLRTAPAPMYFLSGIVRDSNYKVVITGEGADEMLAGYDIFKETVIRRFWARQPDSKYRPLLLKNLYPYMPNLQGAKAPMLKFFFGYKLEETASPVYSHLIRWNNTSRIQNHFSPDLKQSVKDYDPVHDLLSRLPANFNRMSPLAKAQWLESTIFLSGYLLSSQGDRMAMANSVEGRYPFLDHRIIEFCSRLSPDLKLNGLNEKYLLKKLMKGKLPDPVLQRPKQAYRAPITSSFIYSNPVYLSEMLAEQTLMSAGLFDHKSVQQLLNNMKMRRIVSEVDNMAITGILSTQILYHQYVNRSADRHVKTMSNQCKIVNEE